MTPKVGFQVTLVAFATPKVGFQVALVAFATPKVSFQVTLVAFATPIVSSAVARRPQLSSLCLCVSLFSNANHEALRVLAFRYLALFEGVPSVINHLRSLGHIMFA
ncbi:hypothetical protein [Nostoc sp.]|uniref:hypothetical protein n=1 Tax=Nostoc sp. TaxID=1180 RepID=UPI002FF786A1